MGIQGNTLGSISFPKQPSIQFYQNSIICSKHLPQADFNIESVVPMGYFALQALCTSLIVKATMDEDMIGLNANTIIFV